MKRCAAILLAVLTSLTLAACSKEIEPTAEPLPVIEPTEAVDEAPEDAAEPTDEPDEYAYINGLNGSGSQEPFDGTRPYAVMLNNISVALPQCGQSAADVIYEVPAEGGITRCMAIFSDISGAGALGSIRSIRPYYLDIANAYDAIIVHAGGSDAAYLRISNEGIETLDGVRGKYGESIFYRDSSRMSAGTEHSMFTTSDLVLEYTETLGYRREHTGGQRDYGLRFSTEPMEPGGSGASEIAVTYTGGKNTSFSYDESSGQYYMSQYGVVYLDGNNESRVGFSNVLILYAQTINTGDEYGHLEITLEGEGDASLAIDGQYSEITWQRSAGGSFSYAYENGLTCEFKPGRTFVCVVPVGCTVTIS